MNRILIPNYNVCTTFLVVDIHRILLLETEVDRMFYRYMQIQTKSFNRICIIKVHIIFVESGDFA